ncbi:UDP-N-acetylglucosamine--N-acetylmuramyl-(pentapeptide) pyrophosphoryl-undecaprenol N-acetylglucosamine transferase [Streptomyces sp. N50]|uniref:UDP-N-acetylglucosamine--N-acetylmuramyl- (pentapeptide) pyrophosphoryl-undecaprenol N-acetylglucosamine transferase n=1 Tax=Streptomyces sp. N50 TaxID=3081765 RepID=UPI00296200C5|nr:UDP-N-acetylglucosamine--N-acetylmuramyl-(pentapeptide) pyrophosphoryl-undecaprenol N-acetylglucosamine transferase [Streptomyces sp. N50]WOX11445.1 UDP-N-acetylglucosamine--N-acetylmuramyl-(pentapeptide) pyrophosphoryl-undecaprenol N-acetylglucosamine transferase [Streptomyces sp. N50]
MTSADLDRRLAALGRPFRLIVTGGGTGGHTYPALTAIRTTSARLDRLGIGLEVLWVGTATGLEARVAEREGIPFKTVATGKIRRSSNPLKLASPANIKDMGRVPLGAVQARTIVSEFEPDVVLSTGGYVAVPVGLAARFCRRPLVIHEQTVRLGLANRALARAATRIAVSSESTLALLPESVRSSAVVTGNPVRPEVLTGEPDKAISALGLTGFDRTLPTVYITGGAQGSVQINTVVRAILPWLLTHANVIHQCGATSIEESRRHAAQLPDDVRPQYLVTDFVGPELPDVLTLADVVISRSGAGTIAELTALGKPSVLIPLATSAGNEQEHNALHLQRAGAAVALVKEAVTAEGLRAAVYPILSSPKGREQMAERAQSVGRPDAAERLTDVLLSVAV